LNNKNRRNNKRWIQSVIKTVGSILITLLSGICFVFPVYAGTVGDVVTQVAGNLGNVEYVFEPESVTGLNLQMHAGAGDYKNGYGSMAVVGPIVANEKQAIMNRLVDYSGSTGSTTTPMSGGEVREYTMPNGVILAVVLSDYIIVIELYESGDSAGADFQAATQYAQQLLDGMEKNGLLSKAAPDLESVISGNETPSGDNATNNGNSTSSDNGSTEENHHASEAPVAIGPVGNIPGPANNTESVVGVVVPGLLATALGAIVGLAGGGFTPVGGSSTASSEVEIKRSDSSSSNKISKDTLENEKNLRVDTSEAKAEGISDYNNLKAVPYEGGAPPSDGSEIIIDTSGLEEIDLISEDQKTGITPLDEITPTDGSENIIIDTSAIDGLTPGSSLDETQTSVDELSDAREYDADGFVEQSEKQKEYDANGLGEDENNADGYNQEGYDSEGFDRESYNRDGYNREGYDKEGFNEGGFDRAGYNAEGYDKEGLDREGYNPEGYDREGYDKSGYDSEGYDKEGLDREGYNPEGYDREGYDKNGYDRPGYNKDGFNEKGFDREGYNRDGYDSEGYDKEGLDREGYNPEGYDREGYDKNGYDRPGYNKDGFNEKGFDREGYNRDGYDSEGYDKEGLDREGYNPEGFDREGYDKNGYDRPGYNKDGYNRDGYNVEGYDKDGYDISGMDHEGYGRDGYNLEGLDKEGYDRTGFNSQGYDKAGFNKNGLDQEGYGRNGFNAEGLDREGFDVNGYNAQSYNRSGFDAKGFNKAGYDKSGFDRNGFDKAGYNKSGFKDGFDREGYDQNGYNKEGYNRDGYDRQGKNQSGYDEYGYDKKGFNKDGYDRDGYDLEGFDYKGYNRDGYDPWGYDRQGYGKDGYHWSGYNREGLDRNGKPWDDLGYDPNNRNPFDGGPVIIGHPEPDGTEGFGGVQKPHLDEPYPKTAEKYGPKSWTTPETTETPITPETPEVSKTPATPTTPDTPEVPKDTGIIGPEDPMNTLNQHPLGVENQTTPETPEGSKIPETPEVPKDTGIIGPEDPMNTLNQHPLGVENQTAPVPPTTEVPPEPESMVVTTSVHGAQTLIVKDPKTGQWIDSDTGAIFDIDKHNKDFPQQVKDYQDYSQRNDELEKSGQTSMQQALDKIKKDAKAEFDAIQNEIDKRKMDQLKWDQQQAIWDQQQAEKGTGLGSIIAHTMANAGGEIVQTGKDIAEGTGNIVSEVVDAGKDVWNDPSIITNTVAGSAQDIQNGLAAVKKTTEYIYNNPKEVWEKGKAVGKGIGKAVISVITDPKKAWEFAKNTVGIENFENSLDPNRSLASRIGQVLIGTGKLYITILTVGQVGTVLESGAAKITGAVDDLLGVGAKKIGGKAIVKTGIKTTMPVSNGAAYVNAPKPPNISGITKTSQKIIQNTADEWGVQIKIRPPAGKAKQLLESGEAVPKAADMKAKTLDLFDELLGGPKNSEGLVGYYNPKLPPKEVWNNLSNKSKKEIAGLYKTRRREFNQLTEEIKNIEKSGKYHVVENGPQKGLVTQRMEDGTYKSITSDADLADIRNFDGSPVKESVKKQVIQSMSKKTGSNVMHEDLISWSEDAKTGFDIKKKVKMVNKLQEGKEGVTSFNPLAKPTSNYLKGKPIDPGSVHTNEELKKILAENEKLSRRK